MIQIFKPYSIDKKLGKAYNESMSLLPDDGWGCLMDMDAMFLTPDAGHILHEYAKLLPDAGLLTCYTNRIHPKADQQLLHGVSENFSVDFHQQISYNQKRELFKYTELKREVSGFLMLVPKKVWNEIKFDEFQDCLGVDNEFSWALFNRGKKIYRMDGLYVWHSYRIGDITNKKHLL
jgi:GT2 family glycosyltransferase